MCDFCAILPEDGMPVQIQIPILALRIKYNKSRLNFLFPKILKSLKIKHFTLIVLPTIRGLCRLSTIHIVFSTISPCFDIVKYTICILLKNSAL